MARERIERSLEQVDAYRASGLKAKVWAQAGERGVIGIVVQLVRS